MLYHGVTGGAQFNGAVRERRERMKVSLGFICGIGILSLTLMGCVSGLQGSSYSRSEALQIQDVEFGILLSTRPVVIQGTQSEKGQFPGAIIGGVAGSSIGEGKGKEIFMILGAVGGAVIGSMVEEKATRTQGLELSIRLDSSRIISIVQEVETINEFQKGQRVRVLVQGQLARVSPE